MPPSLKSVVLHLATSSRFQSAPRLAALLHYLANEQESGAIAREYAIGVDVLERPASFDPRLDSIVRVHISRLRQRIAEYYEHEGKCDEVRLEIPKGEYRLTLRTLVIGAQPVDLETSAAPAEANEPVIMVDGRSPGSSRPPALSPQLGRGFALGAIFLLAIAAVLYWRYFLPGGSAIYLGADVVTQGDWTGVYGEDGQIIPNKLNNPPGYAEVTVPRNLTYTWWAQTTDRRALQQASGSTRRVASQFHSPEGSANTLEFRVKLTDGRPHRFAMYLCDWDNAGRSQTISISDGRSDRLLDTRTYTSFRDGIWLIWSVSGTVVIRVHSIGNLNSTVNGMFLGGDLSFTPALLPAQAAPPDVPGGSPLPVASASFVEEDKVTLGNWPGVYGADGQIIPNQLDNPPHYAKIRVSGASAYTWWNKTGDPRALLASQGSADRIASQFYSPPNGPNRFSIIVDLQDGKAHRLALYLCDWDNSERAQRISLVDVGTNRLLGARDYSHFVKGVWSVWTITGHVAVSATGLRGINPTVNGIFFQ